MAYTLNPNEMARSDRKIKLASVAPAKPSEPEKNPGSVSDRHNRKTLAADRNVTFGPGERVKTIECLTLSE